MKYSPRFTFIFTPGSPATLDLSATANAFNIRGLLAVLNNTTGALLFAAGTAGLGYSAISGGNVLTLQASTVGMAATDNLVFIYDDGVPASRVQAVLDTGRNIANLFTPAAVAATAAEALLSLTGFTGVAAVAATSTPAVVTTGKTRRIQLVKLSFISTTTAGYAVVNLRANAGGVVTVTSPLVTSWKVGAPTPSGVNPGQIGMTDVVLPMGMEFAAGTGLGLTLQGFSPAGAATANGYVSVGVEAFEY